MRDRKSITSITCTRTSGCKHRTTTTRLISIVRRSDQVSHSLLKSRTAAPATETRPSAIQSSTATSIRTSRRACGNCGARTMYSKQERCWTPTVFPLPVHVRCPTVKSLPEHRRPQSCRSQPSRWRRCRLRLYRVIRSSVRQSQDIVRQIHRSTRSMMAACRDTSSRAELPITLKHRLDFSKELITAVAQSIAETGTASEIAAMQYHEHASASRATSPMEPQRTS